MTHDPVAFEKIARDLYFGFERVDPSGVTWESLDEQDRDMYRSALRFALDTNGLTPRAK